MLGIRSHLPRQGNKPCVCGLCNCGRHHCPGVVQQYRFEGNTTYHEQYTPKTSEGHENYAPVEQPIVTPSPFNHFVTTNMALLAKGAGPFPDKVSPYLPKSTLATSSVNFIATTTNKADFPGYQPQQRARSAPPKRSSDNISFSSGFSVFETTNSVMQGPVAQAIREGAVRKSIPMIHPVTLSNSTVALDATTSYKHFYPPKKSSVLYERLANQRRNAPVSASMFDDRDFRTTKMMHYVAPKFTSFCPAAAFAKRPASTDGHITIRN